MIVSQLVTEVRDTIDDPQLQWTDVELVRAASRKLRGLFRRLIEKDEGYANARVLIRKEDLRELYEAHWIATLPPWVENVTRVYELPATIPAGLRLAEQLTDTLQAARPIPRRDGDEARSAYGWEYTGDNQLTIIKGSPPDNLVVRCAKTPAPLAGMTLTVNAPSTTQVDFPPTLTYGSEDLTPGVYANSEWMVTASTSDPETHQVTGDTRRCVDSDPKAYQGTGPATRVTRLTFESAYTASLLIGDALQMVVPLKDQHTRLLVIETAIVGLAKYGNQDIIRAMADEHALELGRFEDAISPRHTGPFFFQHQVGGYGGEPEDADRDPALIHFTI